MYAATGRLLKKKKKKKVLCHTVCTFFFSAHQKVLQNFSVTVLTYLVVGFQILN